MRILYSFGDNDFRHTFKAVFTVILQAVEGGHIKKDRLSDKEFVCSLINELAYPMYRVAQCNDFPAIKDARFASSEEQRGFYTSYFEATPDKIYIDREIDDLIAKYGDGNYAWFVLDTEQHDPKWRVYAL